MRLPLDEVALRGCRSSCVTRIERRLQPVASIEVGDGAGEAWSACGTSTGEKSVAVDSMLLTYLHQKLMMFEAWWIEVRGKDI
jgi:hypothetical protein